SHGTTSSPGRLGKAFTNHDACSRIRPAPLCNRKLRRGGTGVFIRMSPLYGPCRSILCLASPTVQRYRRTLVQWLGKPVLQLYLSRQLFWPTSGVRETVRFSEYARDLKQLSCNLLSVRRAEYLVLRPECFERRASMHALSSAAFSRDSVRHAAFFAV